MVKSMFAAVAGLKAHQQKMDVIGNNIANVNTFGYKKARVSFADQFYSTLSRASDAGNNYGGGNPQQVGYGSQVGSIDVNYGTGGTAATDMGMDVMIQGQGFFMVSSIKDQYRTSSMDTKSTLGSPTALDLTRVGSFNIDGQGNLVTANKMYVYGFNNQNGIDEVPEYEQSIGGKDQKVLESITVPYIVCNNDGSPKITDGKYEITTEKGEIDENTYGAPMKLYNVGIGEDGTISGINDLKQNVVIGKVAVANVPNPNALEAQGLNIYRAGANTGVVTGEVPGEGSTGILATGRLEMSNVDLAQEFTEMITTQRGYQANTRIITVTDEMLQELVNLKR